MTLANLQELWFALVCVLFAGYSILDGFDLGLGALLPLLGKKKEEKDILIASIGPVWDGNEVWLITGGGALFAAFPQAYATAFSGFYIAMMLVLFSLIFRAVSMEFRSHDTARAGFWEASFTTGSFFAALLFGVALGNVVFGVPLDSKMEYTGDFFTLLRPMPLLFGVTGLAAVLAQGASYAAMKTENKIRERAFGLLETILPFYFVLALLYMALVNIFIKNVMTSPLFIAGAVISIAALTAAMYAREKQKERILFASTSTALLGLWAITAAAHYPNLIKASNDAALSITTGNASTSLHTLTLMSWIAIIGMPVVLAYTIFVYSIFKGKAKALKY
ncbi:MAG: cytochrome d ubiquinol oxidase subunit II [Candidatus Goldiibacteriota bacterium]|jgi:cytochrome d ubiquinol oxidase subunit II